MKRPSPSLADPRQPRTATATLRSMQLGQHLIAVVLAVIGVVRAVAEGTAPVPAMTAAAAVLLWYGMGVVLSLRHRSPAKARWWLTGLTLLWVDKNSALNLLSNLYIIPVELITEERS